MKTTWVFSMLAMLIICGCGQGSADTRGGKGGAFMNKVEKSEKEWRELLTPEQYRVLRRRGTERPFSGQFHKSTEDGIYLCGACGSELFKSDAKFESGTGWPSFYEAIDEGKIVKKEDRSHGMARTEVVCAKCESHLGHLFNDGPKPTGMRYCINSAALGFKGATATREERIVLGAGCFWCADAAYQSMPGVRTVTVGFMGGRSDKTSYKDVVKGETGHAEVAEIVFDPEVVTLKEILDVFWQIHDPTSLNRQGADVGTQYRSAIFYTSDDQRKAAEASMAEAQKHFERRMVTELVEAGPFHKAEDYHQDYYNQNPDQPYCRMVIRPKLEKLRGKKAR